MTVKMLTPEEELELCSKEDKDLDQAARVLKYLIAETCGQKPPLTPMRAWIELGVYRVAATIYKLRNVGYCIVDYGAVVNNTYGEPCKVACYRLVRASP